MTRITSAAANTILINRFLQTQRTLNDLQLQVSTEKKSQTYSGISIDTQRLLNIENTRDGLERFQANNDLANLRNNIQSSALEGIQEAVRDFRGFLVDFSAGNTSDHERIEDIQDNAVRAMLSLQTLLNTEADGRFVFAGGNVRTEPVNFGISSLSAFQTKFDGVNVTVPTTRDAHLEDFSIDRNNTNLSPAFLSFQQAGANGDSRINSAVAQFQNVAVGTTITLSGTAGGLNDGTFTVKAVDTAGTWIDVQTKQLTDETTLDDVTFTFPSVADPLINESFTAMVTFDRQTNTINDPLGGLGSIPAGTVLTITDAANAANNSTFTVASNDGTDLVVQSKRLVTDGGTGAVVHTAGANTLQFVDGGAAADTIVSSDAVAAVYSNLEVGQRIEIAGTGTNNDGRTFTVGGISADGTTITLATSDAVVATAALGAGTVSTHPEYYDLDAATPLMSFTGGGGDTIAFTNPSTITLAGGATFTDQAGNNLVAGDVITIAGGTANDGSYTIASVAGGVATIAETTIVTAGAFAGGTLSVRHSMTFTDNDTPTADTISGRPGAFFGSDGQALPAGTVITIANATSANINNSFTIGSVNTDGSIATLIPTDNFNIGGAAATELSTATLTISAANTKGTVAAASYYKGDEISLTHRASKSRSFEFDTTGIDPAFEKAARAIQLIMQGVTGTEGGLDQNSERISQSLFLLDSALDITNTSPPPFGSEQQGSIEEISISLGFRSVLIDNINDVNTNVIGFLDASVADTENADPLESITRLLDNQRVLEASFQAFSRVRQLSLTSFL